MDEAAAQAPALQAAQRGQVLGALLTAGGEAVREPLLAAEELEQQPVERVNDLHG